MITRATIAAPARRQLQRAPRHIVVKLMAWIESVECEIRADGGARIASVEEVTPHVY